MKSEGLCVGGGACTGRGFDQHAMLALVEGVLTDGKAGGFGLTRKVISPRDASPGPLKIPPMGREPVPCRLQSYRHLEISIRL
jgi:hypothetical protein